LALRRIQRKKGAPIIADRLIRRIYEQRQYRAAWTSEANVAALLEKIDESEAHGLDPEDFHRTAILSLEGDVDGAGAQADLDILLTDALVRLGYQHYFGKVDPVELDSVWNFERPLIEDDPAPEVNAVLDGEQVGAFIAELEVSDPWYDEVRAALARYRGIAEEGGWPEVPAGPALKPGMTDPRVPTLRARLAATGDWQGADAGSDLYDDALEAAVRVFQARHGLEEDGVVGAASLEALNVPVDARIDQIRVNLERGRWILHNLESDFVVVNIAGFETYLIRDDAEIWTTRSIVGREYRKTPVFRDQIRYIEFNPTWTVPPGILTKDILPKARTDPSYITQQGFYLVDGAGNRVDASTFDWSTAEAGRFPYSLVQPPGPQNALGIVKFMFPNEHLVYLHDTASRGLFAETERALSSGCVRIQNPLHFAELLLADQPGWTRARIDDVIASGKTTVVNLDTPLSVLLLYWTVWVDPDGQVSFRKDIYERDAAVLQALNDDFRPRPLLPEE
jgi:murein L,D-transpeptidase YcbB/YkuD